MMPQAAAVGAQEAIASDGVARITAQYAAPPQ
jgi:hypothetical protein